jgi:hypothetical protein
MPFEEPGNLSAARFRTNSEVVLGFSFDVRRHIVSLNHANIDVPGSAQIQTTTEYACETVELSPVPAKLALAFANPAIAWTNGLTTVSVELSLI